MGYLQLIAAALSIVDKAMDMAPNYEQRKKQKYYKLKREFLNEITREDGDDNRIGNLRDELLQFLETFNKEIQ